MMRAVKKHAKDRWIELYIERWLKAPMQDEDGNLLKRERGTPQGGVISPLLANLFLHYAFDLWMRRKWKHLPFERALRGRQHRPLQSEVGSRVGPCGCNSTVKRVRPGTASGEDEVGLLQGCKPAGESSEREIRLSGVYVSTSGSRQSQGNTLLTVLLHPHGPTRLPTS